MIELTADSATMTPVDEPSLVGCATVTQEEASGSERARTPRSGAITLRNASISDRR